MTYANNLDPDEAQQNVGLHLRSKLFDIQITYKQKKLVETMDFEKKLKETNFWKNYPACKELKLLYEPLAQGLFANQPCNLQTVCCGSSGRCSKSDKSIFETETRSLKFRLRWLKIAPTLASILHSKYIYTPIKFHSY